jgi:hypothetical protein
MRGLPHVAKGLRVGAKVCVAATHRDQHGTRLHKGTCGYVREVADRGQWTESYGVEWRQAGRIFRTYVWTRHDPPIVRAGRRRRGAA